ncbi:carbohydrate ABC transporter permease [Alloscardovia omnicolens]|uniref:carbohydrate ABC transporter permease n=1 Tax=Alloscardovia omnicolens TaxID=419015 RepID=UPI0006692370|nr:carbohydrate ABC transporter permease [Alloscardovia omnicolens]MBS6346971.1 carbohydrate ABC transporter permease [Alloscardovia omnicolens]MDK6251129.1 carbohydrate ABC transporter permease [Alloscardovia omnicolens]MDK6328378.1 carbohydrate ABC transporter permease [Alloscardovia omnicolens]MDK6644113.1 carbohydrate ABC transporter permease [Alloscardovia omnicolens]MDK8081740.1 carbohydrate ABC transporter permease [Alloscardovia omnicolens]
MATSTRISTRIPRARKIRTGGDWLILAFLIVGGLVMLFPFIVLLLNAFKTTAQYNSSGPLSIPTELQFDGLMKFWNRVNYPEKLWNSVWTSGLVAVLAVILSMFNAFALGIGRVKGRRWIILLIMLANMLPQEAMLYPLYIMFKEIGLYNSQWAVVIIFTVIQSAFGTYLLSSVYGTFPSAILEAATIDGANRWTIFTKIVYPISKPTLSVMLVFFFIWTWNEYMIPMAFLIDNNTQTIPIAVASLSGDRLMDVTTIAAASLISIVPTLVFYLIFQRTLARGITTGAVK